MVYTKVLKINNKCRGGYYYGEERNNCNDSCWWTRIETRGINKKIAKPAVPFGGKYRIIDFPLSNCSNSGIYTVGVLTQYQPLELNTHIGIGSAWDLDRRDGGVSMLPPYQDIKGGIGIRVQLMLYTKT